jgi:hypothetical protein
VGIGLRGWFALVLVLVTINPAGAASQTAPDIQLTFDKLFFSRTDTFTATGRITNTSEDVHRSSRLTISVYPAIGSGPLAEADTSGSPLVTQTWFQMLPPGVTEIALRQQLDELDIGEGVYPAELKLTLADNLTLVDRSFLIIVDPKDKPLPVALVWSLHQRERRLPNGVFSDNALAALIDNRPNTEGLLSRQLKDLASAPSVKVNLAISPTLGRQLNAMAGGYSWRREKTVTKVPKDGREALMATDWLKRLQKLSDQGQVEILGAPYGQAVLPLLAGWGWLEEGAGQVKRFSEPENKVLPAVPAAGFYLPGLLVDATSAGWIADNGFAYAVAMTDAQEVNGPKVRPPLKFGRDGRDLTIFSGDPDMADRLTTVAPEKAAVEITALLAQRLLTGGRDIPVIIAPPDPDWSPSPDLLRGLYQALSETDWVETINLSTALALEGRPAKLAAVHSPKPESDYRRKLRATRRLFKDFSAGVSRNNALRQRLESQFYIAQSIDYLDPKEKTRSIGDVYLDDIDRTIEGEFKKLELVPPPGITFSTKNGKVPIVIVNHTDYPIKARVVLSGKEFGFGGGKRSEIVLMPKENVISRDVQASFIGSSEVTVDLFVGERRIAESQIEVKVSSFLRYLVVIASGFLVVLAAVVIVLKGRSR